MKREYEITQAQLDQLLDAMKPVPLIAIHLGMPSSVQERANDAWARLGDELGFAYMTVEPSTKGDRFFIAEPKP